ncbi:NADH-quinone oxidoreductase subunit C [Rhodocytophaga rosea]|uniref:NADH-quinone oxidoreductase subunit C n=1 Tax=Rhodocytophaga rosea TaxID=2704465 RepID=A0A6C0GKB2_9BACT|nr:NADH-quinone oxidoreductase subunit C [Rhodocytophaga rosea]QHT68387.1 NADH-quinone oxidoreductase subunit C [Rhodocytophaga rosea]
MNLTGIKQILVEKFGEEIILKEDSTTLQPGFTIHSEKIAQVCQFLHEDERTYFDFLSCLTAIDNGPEKATMEVIYHLYSIPYHLKLVLRLELPRPSDSQYLPEVPTISHIWRTADWHEREAYDLMGIKFTGHPDLRRILLTADWQGFPLRKDYQAQEYYHGIKVAY